MCVCVCVCVVFLFCVLFLAQVWVLGLFEKKKIDVEIGHALSRLMSISANPSSNSTEHQNGVRVSRVCVCVNVAVCACVTCLYVWLFLSSCFRLPLNICLIKHCYRWPGLHVYIYMHVCLSLCMNRGEPYLTRCAPEYFS